ncbi:hypothetical protein ASF45_21250 [Pseudorhodoferax sp. Leaf265]|nr:hypothetical protein ASF45_21250 [Pseudorhodoferax sp. Leaf265]
MHAQDAAAGCRHQHPVAARHRVQVDAAQVALRGGPALVQQQVVQPLRKAVLLAQRHLLVVALDRGADLVAGEQQLGLALALGVHAPQAARGRQARAQQRHGQQQAQVGEAALVHRADSSTPPRVLPGAPLRTS